VTGLSILPVKAGTKLQDPEQSLQVKEVHPVAEQETENLTGLEVQPETDLLTVLIAGETQEWVMETDRGPETVTGREEVTDLEEEIIISISETTIISTSMPKETQW
jgi:hypothetical protein